MYDPFDLLDYYYERPPMFTLSGEDIANALNVINDFRAETGIDKLDDLPYGSSRTKAKECVLARAFNFDCGVYKDEGRWYVRFEPADKDKADKLAKILDGGSPDFYPSGGSRYSSEHHRVWLPQAIFKIAVAFDAYKLDSKYYAYPEGVRAAQRRRGIVKPVALEA